MGWHTNYVFPCCSAAPCLALPSAAFASLFSITHALCLCGERISASSFFLSAGVRGRTRAWLGSPKPKRPMGHFDWRKITVKLGMATPSRQNKREIHYFFSSHLRPGLLLCRLYYVTECGWGMELEMPSATCYITYYIHEPAEP